VPGLNGRISPDAGPPDAIRRLIVFPSRLATRFHPPHAPRAPTLVTRHSPLATRPRPAPMSAESHAVIVCQEVKQGNVESIPSGQSSQNLSLIAVVEEHWRAEASRTVAPKHDSRPAPRSFAPPSALFPRPLATRFPAAFSLPSPLAPDTLHSRPPIFRSPSSPTEFRSSGKVAWQLAR
jgi:hypothetical protein